MTTSPKTPTPPTVAPAPVAEPSDDRTMSVEVEPRKPRVVWQGMDRQELVSAVPTQVVEIVRPRRAVEHKDALAGMDLSKISSRSGGDLPPNRLIWTNDNIVALRTLLDDRDQAGEYRYRGKVDLIYIDPPFMVQGDFRADNTIEVELDENEHIEAKKEPSLVEMLAYKDTWRQGLDSFLSMLRARLLLLKDLLAPTGSIYVHLDWHAVHYVKVMMDEIFGYENFVNEIVWQRSTGKSLTTRRLPSNHDIILSYGNGGNRVWNNNDTFVPYDVENPDAKTASKYSQRDSAWISGRGLVCQPM
jgi:adenine-specific DNA-methyltransferase